MKLEEATKFLDGAYVCDVETIGYLEDIRSFEDLHVLCCGYKNKEGVWQIKDTKSKEDIVKLVSNPKNVLVFHNGVCYDKPVLEKMGLPFNAEIIDTLPISYYLYSELDKHGLAFWGERLGVKKPEIESWTGLSYEEYKNRCTEDVKINVNLWVMMLSYLRELYEDDRQIVSVIRYLNHKMNVIFSQDQNPILIDLEQCQKNLDFLQEIIKDKEAELNGIMPKIPMKTKRKKPSIMFKKDGSLSKAGETWMHMVEKCNLPEDYEGEIEVINSYSEPNCQSSQQMKNFLFEHHNWKPKLFKDGANGKVPQLRDDDKNLCESIQQIIKRVPELEALDGLSVATHRSSYLKSFLDSADENGYAKAWAHSFTRTLRLKHSKPFVNLPKPDSSYGELVRGVMVAPKGYVCIGADLSSIEDKCKQISIFPYDPKYVESMNTKGWDAHLSLGLRSGKITEDDVQFYKWFKTRDKEDVLGECPESFKQLSEEEMATAFGHLDKERAVFKTSTYALTYGCGIAKLMESAEIPQSEAKSLHKGYWDLNNSVKQFAKDRVVKKVKGRNWLRKGKKAGGLLEVNELEWIWNEYSNMWLFLKSDKDRFSACNQNFGVKVFDVWCYYLLRYGIPISGNWHDEAYWYCKEEDVDNHVEIIKKSIEMVNKVFNPPVRIECDYKIGDTYSKVH